ncbi:hypothetical protein CPT34_25470 [Rhizobium sophoriradicis]|uniref:Uncharacterized protein n=1 Tax=Rhizobium sophoriradicis TaxID=1535245 RepID=A0A2A5KMJ6_9HYPH|nr:hypothetical protein CPT34_25470 [Rhizobium sophoriradicis]
MAKAAATIPLSNTAHFLRKMLMQPISKASRQSPFEINQPVTIWHTACFDICELVARVPALRTGACWSESHHRLGEKSHRMHGGTKARETS